MTRPAPHLRLLVPEPTNEASEPSLPVVMAWFDEDGLLAIDDEPTLPSMPALTASNQDATQPVISQPGQNREEEEDDWLELDDVTEPVMYAQRTPAPEPPSTSQAVPAAPAPPDPPPERLETPPPPDPAPVAPASPVAGASSQLVQVPVHLPVGHPVTVTVSTHGGVQQDASRVAEPSAAEKALIFKLQVEVDVAHEGLLLWRSTVVLLLLIALTMLRMYLLPGDVPWR